MSEKIVKVSKLPINIRTGAIYNIVQDNINSYTHGMFKYPCKFIPEIPRWAISSFLNSKKSYVLDPFAGSGTTLLEANICGHNALGTEIDDVCKLIVKVKTTKLSKKQLLLLDEYNNTILKRINRSNDIKAPEIKNINHWFSKKTIKQMGNILYSINKIPDRDIKDFFSVCFVSIIKKVSNADDISPKPYVSTRIIKKKRKVVDEWTNTYNKYKKMICELSKIHNLGKSKILAGDALRFNTNKKVDLAITSPPYINAFDYGRAMRLENIWLNYLTEQELADKKKEYIGTEKINIGLEEKNLSILNYSPLLKKYYTKIKKVDRKRALIVKKFYVDIYQNLVKVNSVLKNKGKYVIVIGNSTIRNIKIENWKIISELSKSCGYTVFTHFSYIIRNKYIRIPRNGVGGKINKDYILVLSKEK